MSEQQLREEWSELTKDFKTLEATNKVYLEKLEELNRYQAECQKQIQHQKYRMEVMGKNVEKSKVEDLRDELLKRQTHLGEIEQTLPKKSSIYLRAILGSVNVSILSADERVKYKSEYEKFKLILSAVSFVLAVINLWFVSRRLEKFYLFIIMWYYCTLTVRESILRVNGSRIKGWWWIHHFISMVASAILLILPESLFWDQFRTTFMIFNAYLSVVQYLQYRYQSGVLYRLKALGVRHSMDITVDGFHSWMWRGLGFLFPFLFAVYLFQFYVAYTLHGFGKEPESSWHVRVLGYLFFVLSVGNTVTTLRVILDKYKNRILSQRLLYYKWLSNSERKSDKRQ